MRTLNEPSGIFKRFREKNYFNRDSSLEGHFNRTSLAGAILQSPLSLILELKEEITNW